MAYIPPHLSVLLSPSRNQLLNFAYRAILAMRQKKNGGKGGGGEGGGVGVIKVS